MFYDELPSDSTSVRLGGSVLNAIFVVCGITAMTFFFVLCFKYRFYKVILISYHDLAIKRLSYYLVSVFLVGIISFVSPQCNNICIMDVRSKTVFFFCFY